MKFICGSNYFNQRSFDEMCKELESGEHIKVGIDCIGHARNNMEQERYREELVEKYGNKLEVNCNEGVCSYSYNYKLNV